MFKRERSAKPPECINLLNPTGYAMHQQV